MIRRFFFLLFLVNTTACSLDEQEICGNWQALAFSENGKSIEIPRRRAEQKRNGRKRPRLSKLFIQR